MTPEEKFEFQRAAFRRFVADKTERECELLINDLMLRIAYLRAINPVNIIQGLHDMESTNILDGD